ncbi:MAG: arylesterase [Bacteroidota bacterium]|nr:arylesterase [Bacteroidota bacterium]
MMKKPLVLIIVLLLLSACEPGKVNQEEQNSVAVPEVNNEESIQKHIVFFGNSLTAGYGLDPSEAFPALIQNKIDSLKLNYTVINAGLSGETTAGGKTRIDWVLRQPMDVFLLELGANDGLRGILPSESKKNLQEIIDRVKKAKPEVEIVLVGMQMPPSMGRAFTEEFKNIYPQLAKENNIRLVPFLLEGVGGERSLNLQDGIHPNEAGHKRLAENVWPELKPILIEG